MRSHVLMLFFLSFLLVLMAGSTFLPAGAETITGSVDFDPSRIDLSLPAPSTVKGTIRFENDYYKDINASSVQLEGRVSPFSTYLVSGGFVAVFDGDAVVNVISEKIGHEGLLPPYKVWLTITGKLNDGTPFSATGYIKVSVPHSPSPF